MAYEDHRFALGFAERVLRDEFGHTVADAEAHTKAFYHAACAGQIFPRPWEDEDILHEGAGLAYYVQYHMAGRGHLRAAAPQFFEWRSACLRAHAGGNSPPPVPEEDA
jgi:hypothetical protein